MNQLSRLVVLVVAGMATLGLLSGCAGTAERERSAQAPDGTAEIAGAPLPRDMPNEPTAERDVVKTASMTITAGDPAAAADKAAAIVNDKAGRVDSRSEDAGSTHGRARTSVVLRVPADRLDEAMAELKALGTVEHAEISTEDVTAQRVDLDARI